jgi:hypothetical protein
MQFLIYSKQCLEKSWDGGKRREVSSFRMNIKRDDGEGRRNGEESLNIKREVLTVIGFSEDFRGSSEKCWGFSWKVCLRQQCYLSCQRLGWFHADSLGYSWFLVAEDVGFLA